jgi:dihydrofolate reductase
MEPCAAMRKIVNSSYLSLDGVVDNVGDWPSMNRGGDEEKRFGIQLDLLQASDIMIMGRRTYEGFAPVWSAQSGDPFSDRINAMDKYVVSSTLSDPEWSNTRALAGDPVAAIRELKEQDGGHIVQYGFGRLSFALLEAGLLDELVLWMHPFFVGRGGPEALLYRETPATLFELADATALPPNLVVLRYRYVGAA